MYILFHACRTVGNYRYLIINIHWVYKLLSIYTFLQSILSLMYKIINSYAQIRIKLSIILCRYLFMILFVTQKRKLFSVNYKSVFLTRKKYTNLKSIFYLKYRSLFVELIYSQVGTYIIQYLHLNAFICDLGSESNL